MIKTNDFFHGKFTSIRKKFKNRLRSSNSVSVCYFVNFKQRNCFYDFYKGETTHDDDLFITH